MRCYAAFSCLLVSVILQNVTPKSHSQPWQCERPKSPSQMNSFLWTIKRDPPSYLFGTIHVPYTRVWDFIPENSKKAFQLSSNVFFELDLTDPYTITALTSCQLLPRGESLQKLLPRELYRRLKSHLDYVKHMMPHWMTPDQRGKGLYADYLFNAIAGNWERKRPVWVMLMVNSLTEADIRSGGPRAGPVPGSGGREAEEEDRGRGEGGGAVPPTQWAQLLTGKGGVALEETREGM
ncbi:metalloprotease TIKI2-like, partial [Huso huso]